MRRAILGPWTYTFYHFVHDHSERKDIHLEPVILISVHLGGHVQQRAGGARHREFIILASAVAYLCGHVRPACAAAHHAAAVAMRRNARLLNGSRESEIGYFDCSFRHIQEEIARFEIAVDDRLWAVRVQVHHSVRNVEAVPQRESEVELRDTPRSNISEYIEEGSAFAEFGDLDREYTCTHNAMQSVSARRVAIVDRGHSE